MADLVITGIENTPEADRTGTIQSTIGPKKIKTVDIEIEMHDPDKLDRLATRRMRKPVMFGQFPFMLAVPKNGCGLCSSDADKDCR